jgi:hypothetical protein
VFRIRPHLVSVLHLGVRTPCCIFQLLCTRSVLLLLLRCLVATAHVELTNAELGAQRIHADSAATSSIVLH